ncbi:MAG: molybdenum cofactor biosynthesis protein MoaA, partial [Candidatus Bathyarchaeota archaeon]|nr:molybdenum cofactor biosynthesis protein MoaA [Candidatus Bathyarchaeota archaeon]
DVYKRQGYSQVRVSGCEPTIAFDHLEELIGLFDSDRRYLFVLETNGILIGAYKEYAERLSRFKKFHVRVSIKGCNSEEFSMLTLADPRGFELQLNALKNLIDEGVSCHPAVMLSFSDSTSRYKLLDRLKSIDDRLVEDFEEEYVFLYPHVEVKLREYGLKPRIAFKPNYIPEDLI